MPISAKALVDGFKEVNATRAAAAAEFVNGAVTKAEENIDKYFNSAIDRAKLAAKSNGAIVSPFGSFKYDGQDTALAGAAGRAALIPVLQTGDFAASEVKDYIHENRADVVWPAEEKGPDNLPDVLRQILDQLTAKLTPDFEVVGWKLTARSPNNLNGRQAHLDVVLRCPEFDRQFGANAAQ